MTRSFERFLPLIEQELENAVTEKSTEYDKAIQAMRYSLLAGGKRIRPVLLLEFYRLCGGKGDFALPFAAAIEMIHTYSLIHDDLPCMDNDDMRRGKPSCHIAFGYDTALLAGDALLTLAFKTAASTNGIAQENVVRAIALLAENAGINGMVGGQVADLALEKSGASKEQLRDMYLRKTSCLISAAVGCGCILAGADDKKLCAAQKYAENLGLAFQITDDILDCTAESEIFGKPVGSDEKNGKTTFVTLLGLDGAEKAATEYTANALAALESFEGDKSILKELTGYLLDRKY